MKRGRAVVWLPPRSDGERAFGSEAHLLAFRGGQAAGSAIEKVSLDGLTGTTQVQLVFDARDVTLLMPEVPMLSGARLAQAVPNIVEDSLLQDAASCAFVIGPPLAVKETSFPARARVDAASNGRSTSATWQAM